MRCGFRDLRCQSVDAEKKNNNRDSTETRKTIKDSEEFGIF